MKTIDIIRQSRAFEIRQDKLSAMGYKVGTYTAYNHNTEFLYGGSGGIGGDGGGVGAAGHGGYSNAAWGITGVNGKAGTTRGSNGGNGASYTSSDYMFDNFFLRE